MIFPLHGRSLTVTCHPLVLAMFVHSVIERSPLCGLIGGIFVDKQILLSLCATFASPFLIYFIKNCDFAHDVSYKYAIFATELSQISAFPCLIEIKRSVMLDL